MTDRHLNMLVNPESLKKITNASTPYVVGIWLFFFTYLLMSQSCTRKIHESGPNYRTWSSIIESDTLFVGTVSSPLVYFLYKGEELGPEYEKIKAFTKAYDLCLSIQIAPNTDTLFNWVKNGDIDLSITPYGMTSEAREQVAFCGEEVSQRIVLLQKESDSIIKQPYELSGKTIYILPNTPEALRLKNINTEIGGGIDIRPIEGDTIEIEEIMLMIVKDSIQYSATDEKTAQLNKTYIPGINTSTPLSFPIPMSWFLAQGNNELRDTIDSFVSKNTFISHEKTMMKRYFEELKWIPESKTYNYENYIKKKGDLSPFDDLFKDEAKRIGWDWQLLASIAFHESRFRPDVKAWSGARGLMGIMPATGRAYGANKEDLMDPKESIRVAASLLDKLYTYFKDNPNKDEAMKLTLASYNAGYGHVLDAQRLAKKYGENENVWDPDVRKYILLKSNPEYYNDPACKCGYLRGRETTAYVENVMQKYYTYKNHYN